MRHVSKLLPDGQSAFLPMNMEPVYTRDELAARADWEELTIRLLAYARKKLWRHGAAAARYAVQPSDLVQEAIASWLEGRRTFDAGTESGLFEFLCNSIDSILCHAKEKTIRHGRQYSIESEGGDGLGNDEISEGRIRAEGDLEREILFHDLLTRFLDTLEEPLATYARYFASVPESSAEQRAEFMRVNVAEIRNLDRRLHRWARQWMHQ